MSTARRYHLGLDWGTSTTKLVLRDYEQARAFVLMPGGRAPTYRYPSTIVLSNDRIFFGFEAEDRRHKASRAFDALKGHIYKQASQKVDQINTSEIEDIATLYLTHTISIGGDLAEEHAKRNKSDALMGMTIGVPAEELEQSSLREIYMRMARCAYELAIRSGYDPQGDLYSDAQEKVSAARKRIEKRDGAAASPDSYKQWLRPELAAAMYWGLKSPKIQTDLYSCIDIGAWTTNVSYFRIVSTNPRRAEKDGIIFFGGQTAGPGVIELLSKVASDHGQDFMSLFGYEERWLCRADCSNHIDNFKEGCFQVWGKGFQQAYRLEPKQSAWDRKVNIMVVGGGSKIPAVRNLFFTSFPYKGWTPGRSVPDLGTPFDLYHFPEEGIIPRNPFNGDYTFLLVAYGLSVHSGDFPQTTLSPQVPPFDPQTKRKKYKDSIDLGYDE